MDANYSGRIFQAYRFEIDYLRGYKVDQCIAVLVKDNIMQPLIITLKIADLPWQMFFLDAAIGFWEQYHDMSMFFDDEPLEDYAALFNLQGAEIRSIRCEPIEEGLTTRFYIEFPHCTLVWRYIDEHDMGSERILLLQAA